MKPIAVGGTALLGSVVLAGALTPGYDQAHDTVSLLGAPGQPMLLVARMSMVVYGVLVLVGAPSIGRRLVTVYGIAAVLAGVVSKDPTVHGSATNTIHVAATVLGGAALLTAMLVAALFAERARLRRISGASACVALFGVLAFRFSWGSATYGLLEKALLLLATSWLLVVAAHERSTPNRRHAGIGRRRAWSTSCESRRMVCRRWCMTSLQVKRPQSQPVVATTAVSRDASYTG